VRAAILAVLALGACDDLVGFSAPAAPLATVRVTLTGTAPAGANPRAALLYGAQWLPEPLCFLPPESPEVAAVVAAGCRDVLAFTPSRATASVPIAPGETAELPVLQLPSGELMVGDLTARVAYASAVVFDDRDGDGDLRLARPQLLPTGEFRGGSAGPDEDDDPEPPPPDPILGASFVSMTRPDRRLAFREGGFVETGYYPRHGCGAPAPGFSILSAGGFSLEAAIAATIAGELPAQDPATCAEDAPDAAIEVALGDPAGAAEVACEQRALDSSIRYRDPPTAPPPGLADRAQACAKIPTLGDDPATAGITQLVIASGAGEACRSITHYTLVGCDDGALRCDHYEWDLRANPPGWWPCE
jgi:hypothetical protein